MTLNNIRDFLRSYRITYGYKPGYLVVPEGDKQKLMTEVETRCGAQVINTELLPVNDLYVDGVEVLESIV